MTHRPLNRLLVIVSGQICLSFHVVVGAYVLAVYSQVVCWPYCALQSCRTDVRQQYCWSTAAASGTLAEDMAAKAGWISSAGSSGSTSSFRALSRYTITGPVEQQIIDRRVGFDHDNYRSIANGCWLITSARVYCQCGLPHILTYTRRNGARFLPQVWRYVHVPKQTYIDFRDNFNFGELVCRRVWLSGSWSVGELSSYLVPVSC